MKTKLNLLCLGVAVLGVSLSAYAQTNVTTTTGGSVTVVPPASGSTDQITASFLPMFTSGSNIENSAIMQLTHSASGVAPNIVIDSTNSNPNAGYPASSLYVAGSGGEIFAVGEAPVQSTGYFDVRQLEIGSTSTTSPDPAGSMNIQSFRQYSGALPLYINQGGGDVTIGSSGNESSLKVIGNLTISKDLWGNWGKLTFPDGTVQTTAWTGSTAISQSSNGYVGIGTSTPAFPLQVVGGPGQVLGVGQSGANGAAMQLLFGIAPSGVTPAGLDSASLSGKYGYNWIQSTDQYVGNTPLVLNGGGGYVGIGTSAPVAQLEINGAINSPSVPTLKVDGNTVLAGTGSSITFPDGTVQSTAWHGVLSGGDYAESVNVAGARSGYEPGDVLVITSENDADVAKSSEPYSTFVSGVYSTKPGILGRRQTGDPKTATNEIPMAMVGIVPTKVSAENGPIHRGDLLVTSSTIGYAMRGTDRTRMLGAVIGKALGSLDAGTGTIEVLVTLQ